MQLLRWLCDFMHRSLVEAWCLDYEEPFNKSLERTSLEELAHASSQGYEPGLGE